MMCMESVFAVISAALILHQVPTVREGIGCAVMFLAIILSQVAEPAIEKHKKGKSIKQRKADV